jgi:pyridoxine kinase
LNILSVQSSVAYGHVGNSAAVFPLQRMGLEVWPVNTVHFSNHTGYGHWRGQVLPAEDVAGIIRGIEERGVLGDCDAVLSGYLGDPSLGEVVVGTVGRVKRLNAKAIYCCAP